MMNRCYSPTNRGDWQRAYGQVTVCLSWQNFDNFFKWAQTQDYEGKSLDKDLLFVGNTEYRPDRCLFISSELNMLLTSDHQKQSDLPAGVWHSPATPLKPYLAVVRHKKVYQLHKRFATVEEASSAYRQAKAHLLRAVATTQTDQRIIQGLLSHAAHHQSLVSHGA